MHILQISLECLGLPLLGQLQSQCLLCFFEGIDPELASLGEAARELEVLVLEHTHELVGFGRDLLRTLSASELGLELLELCVESADQVVVAERRLDCLKCVEYRSFEVDGGLDVLYLFLGEVFWCSSGEEHLDVVWAIFKNCQKQWGWSCT